MKEPGYYVRYLDKNRVRKNFKMTKKAASKTCLTRLFCGLCMMIRRNLILGRTNSTWFEFQVLQVGYISYSMQHQGSTSMTQRSRLGRFVACQATADAAFVTSLLRFKGLQHEWLTAVSRLDDSVSVSYESYSEDNMN